MNKLTVEPIGGLANRMRVISAGRALAHRSDLPLHVNWVLDPSCNCSFTELFETPLGVVVHEIDHSRMPNRLFHRVMPLRVRFSGGCYMGPHDFEKILPNIDFKNFSDDVNGPLYLATCFEFVSGNLPVLVPNKLLQQQIETMTAGFDEHVVGVHIRRSDNSKSCMNSPTSTFVTLMRNELELNPEICFFLATDSLDEEDELQRLFPGKILVHSKQSLNRNEPDAIKDAVIDLYCLARATKIIGSFWSSFSEVASNLGNRELIVACDLTIQTNK